MAIRREEGGNEARAGIRPTEMLISSEFDFPVDSRAFTHAQHETREPVLATICVLGPSVHVDNVSLTWAEGPILLPSTPPTSSVSNSLQPSPPFAKRSKART